MFQLNQAITQWRRQLLAGGINSPEILDELESHLRNEISNLVSSGMTEAEAFQLATSRIGGAAPLRAEFKKLERTSGLPLMIGLGLWLAALAMQARNMSYALSVVPLLFAHIIILSAGYCAAFLTGACGMAYVGYRSLHSLSPIRQRSLGHAAIWFGRLAAGMTLTGLVLGMLWSRKNLGRYWSWNLREIGALCVTIWFVSLSLLQRFGGVSQRGGMLMSIGGNIIVALAWFGAIIAANAPAMRVYTEGSHWLLITFFGIHLVFLALGLASSQKQRTVES